MFDINWTLSLVSQSIGLATQIEMDIFPLCISMEKPVSCLRAVLWWNVDVTISVRELMLSRLYPVVTCKQWEVPIAHSARHRRRSERMTSPRFPRVQTESRNACPLSGTRQWYVDVFALWFVAAHARIYPDSYWQATPVSTGKRRLQQRYEYCFL